MAPSAFKSTSNRGNLATSSKASSSLKDHPPANPGEKTPARRSRSVSAVSRSADGSEFPNKRDNPLYCCSSSSSPETEIPVEAFKGRSDPSGGRRGRSVSRSSGSGVQNFGPRGVAARSLSRVDTGRRIRSVSRDHCGNSESEVEHGYRLASSLRSKEIGSFAPNTWKKTGVPADKFGDSEETMSLRTWTSQHPISEPWDAMNTCARSRNWEDGISTSSFSDAEEMVMRAISRSDHPIGDGGASGIYETVRSEVQRAVSEIRSDIENAIRIKNHEIITAENIVNVPPGLNPTVELLSDIRREYATKIDQSQERARKLRADLAVEEQHGQELSRILKEMLQDPKSSDTHRSRPKRKTSMERLKMSRRLAEEAMNYFDECVSISTFDSSDFSSLDDLQPGSAVGIPAMSSTTFYPIETSAFSASHTVSGHHNHHEDSDYQTPCSLSIAGSDLANSSTCSGSKAVQANGIHDDPPDFDTLRSGNLQFSFTDEPADTVGDDDIRHYIKKFGKELRREGLERVNVRSTYDADDHDYHGFDESLLFDKVIYRRRIESGGMLVCDVRTF